MLFVMVVVLLCVCIVLLLERKSALVISSLHFIVGDVLDRKHVDWLACSLGCNVTDVPEVFYLVI